MALNKELEDLLATLPEEDRGVLRTQLEKHEPLRAGYLRQADYDRKMDEHKKIRAGEVEEIEKGRASIKEWKGWYEGNLNIFNTKKTQAEKLEKEVQTLRDQIAKAAKDGGVEMDAAQIQAAVEEQLKGREYVSKAELASIIAEETKKVAETIRTDAEKNLFEKTLPAWASTVMDYQDVSSDHFNEFGERLDRKALGAFMQEKGIADVKQAHNMFVADKRHAKEVETIRKQVREEVQKELQPVPGSGAGPSSLPAGPVAQRIQRDAEAARAAGTGSRVGDGSAARAAAAELVSEGKF